VKVKLHYGDGFLDIEIPEANVGEIIRPWQDSTGADNAVVVREALECGEMADFGLRIQDKTLAVLIDRRRQPGHAAGGYICGTSVGPETMQEGDFPDVHGYA